MENKEIIRKDFRPQGTCLKNLVIDAKEDKDGDLVIEELRFFGGCSGTNQGMRNLLKGKKMKEIIPLFESIVCKNGTSCQKVIAESCKDMILEHEGKLPLIIGHRRKQPLYKDKF